MSTVKRCISLLLALVMSLGMMPWDALTAEATGLGEVAAVTADTLTEEAQEETTDPTEETVPDEPVEVTRAQWIQALVAAFSMTVEEDVYPDNYYTDISEDDDFYRAVLVAVEFGVIDLDVGLEFRPHDPATREFAAQTLNFCLAYQLDEGATYTFSDVDVVTYPIDAQIALNRGWFEAVDGAFMPEQAITTAEMEHMLEDAAAVLSGAIIDESYNSTYSFVEEIIVIPEGTTVTKNGEDTITIVDSPEQISTGDLFAVYLNGIPCAYSADSVLMNGTSYVIQVTQLTDEEAYTSIDAEGVVYATFTQIEAEEGTEIIYIIDQTGEEFTDPYEAEAAIQALETKSTLNIDRKIKASTEIDVGNGVSISVSTEIENPKIKYSINLAAASAQVSFEGDADISYEVKFDLVESGSDFIDLTDVRLFNCTIPHVGGLVISLDVGLEGAIKGTNSGHLVAGYQYDPSNGGRIIKDFQARSFSLEAEASGKLGVEVKVGLTDLPVVKGYLFAGTGAKASLKVTSHVTDSLELLECCHFAAYWYVEYGAKAEINFFKVKKSFEDTTEFFGESNSPIRVFHHYENGVEVPGCTRDGSSYSNGYYTDGYSRYWGSGWSGGSGGSGYDRDGNPVVVYTYSLDENNNATITGYSGNSNALVIPGIIDGYTVTAIGSSVFTGRTALRSIVLPNTIVSIGSSVFKNCTNLSSVRLSDSLTSIGGSAFMNCTSLVEISLPDTMDVLGCGAFRDCTSLKKVYIPKGMDAGSYAGENSAYPGPFQGCSSLTDITFGEGITYIPSGMFSYCTGLEELIIPETVTSINWRAFQYCTSLKSVYLPDAMEVLGCGAFRYCTALKQVNIPKDMNAGSYAGENSAYPGPFHECSSLTDITFGEGITYIPSGMFSYCTGLEELVIPETVTSINWRAFQYCTSLKSVYLPNAMEVLGCGAFRYCTALEQINIPKNMNTGSYAGENSAYPGPFLGCSSLTDITFGDGITYIPTAMFWNCTGLRNLEIPDTVETICYRAFAGCTSLETVTIPDSVTVIGNKAFDGCSSLTKIVIPDSITSFGNSVFSGCSSMKNAVVPVSFTTIPDSTFADCVSLADIILPNTLTSIKASAFRNCDGFESFVIPQSVTSVGSNCFYDCDALTTITIPNSVTSINSSTFYDCDALTSVTIPYGVTSIGSSAFYDCDALETVNVANSVTSLGTNVFYHCDALRNVDLSRNLTSIPTGTFKECAALEEIVIPYFATSIGDNAFSSSTKLTKVVTHDKLTSISSTAFSYADVTKFYGTPGSYTETWCTENGYTFNENTSAATSVTLSDKAVSIPKGSTYTLDMTIAPADFADTITFKSGNTAVATVDETGKITAVATGTATIKVIVGDASASCKVTVTQAVTKIALDKTTLALDVPDTYQLTATITPTDASNQVLEWTSSNVSAATVDANGLVTAVGNGTAVITAAATDGSGISASCTVTVTDPNNMPVSGITLNQTSLSMEAMDTFQLTATISPDNAANKNLAWTSSDESVATVDANGIVTAVAKGTAIITAAATDESGVTATCSVTVTNTAYIVDDVAKFESSHNYPNSCNDFWVYTAEGAESLSVTFDVQTEIEDGFDYLHIYDGEGNLIGTYTGTELAGQTVEVPGDTVKIQIQSDDSGTEWGFKVTEVKVQKQTETIATGWSGSTTWVLTDDGVLTFSGNGDAVCNMKNYGFGGNQPWISYADQITSVVVEEGVTAVGTGAFMNLTKLETVTLPDSGLKTLGQAAFYGCSSLKEIYIPDGVYTIWAYTFKGCTSLTDLRLPTTLCKLDQGAFENCTALVDVVLPGNVDIISYWAFKGCTGLVSVDMEWTNATEIRAGAFKNCTALTNVILPADIQVLGDSAFYAIGATTFTVPETVTKIEGWCFARSSLKEIIFEGDAPTFGDGVFNKIALTARYPSGNATWTSDIMQNYGGTVTWTAQ